MRHMTRLNITILACWVALVLSMGFSSTLQAQTYSLTQSTAGCYKAKCTQGLTNNINVAPPATISSTLVNDTVSGYGSGAGLGCSSNTSIAACSFNGSGSSFNGVRLFDAVGNEINLAGTPPIMSPFDSAASKSAPVVFADGGVMAIDDTVIGYTPPAHNVWYYTRMISPDGTHLFAESAVSPAIVQGTNTYAFIATSCLQSDANRTTGAYTTCGAGLFQLGASSSQISSSRTANVANTTFISETATDLMQAGGNQYTTANSPAVDTVTNRVYVLAAVTPPSSTTVTTSSAVQGSILAYDVNTTTGAFTANGSGANVTDIYDFSGPSGASPVVIPNFAYTYGGGTIYGAAIFFDGTARSTAYGGPTASSYCTNYSSTGGGLSGCFFGILDTTKYSNPPGTPNVIEMWRHIFPNSDFQAGAGLDMNGTPGIWIFPLNQASYYDTNCPTSGPLSPSYNNCMLKLGLSDGTIVQGPIDLTPVVTQTFGYIDTTNHSDVWQPASAINIIQSGSTSYLVLSPVDKYDSTSLAAETILFDVTASTHTSAPYASAIWASSPFPSGCGLNLGDYDSLDFRYGSLYSVSTVEIGCRNMAQTPKIQQMTFADFERMFPDDDACKQYLVEHRWPGGVCCPKCGNVNVKAHGTMPFHWLCNECADYATNYRFSVLVGTIFENTNKSLREWFRVFHLMMSSKKGMSALQIKRMMGFGAYRTAWSMCHKIRTALIDREFQQLMGIVEVDETFVGGKAKNRHKDKRGGPGGTGSAGGTGGTGKAIVVGAVQRKGNVVARVIESVDSDTLAAFVREAVSNKVSLLATDEHNGYNKVGREYPHAAVQHSIGQYVNGAVHTNTIEGFWSLIKRGIMGSFHKVSAKYLPLYVAEFQFRYNNRLNEDIFGTAVAGC